jgi:hypothetical protein
LFQLAWPDDATRQIKVLNEFLRLRGTLKAGLHDAKFLESVGGGECAVWHFMDYQHLKRFIALEAWGQYVKTLTPEQAFLSKVVAQR